MIRLFSIRRTSGVVLTLPDKNGNLQVAFNTIKAKINISNIKSISKKEAEFNSTSSFISNKQITNEVDLRGLYGDEAVTIVDKFFRVIPSWQDYTDSTLSTVMALVLYKSGFTPFRK